MDEEEIRSLHYFWFEKGDLTRWSGWERVQEKLKEQCPQLLYEINMMQHHKFNISNIIDSLKPE